MEIVNPLTFSEIEILKKDFEVLFFSNDFDLVYENQVPCTGIALIEGHIEFIKDSNVLQTVGEGNLLGVSQLINGKPFRYGCRVKAKSKIILLGKSDILNLKKNNKSKNHPAIKSMKAP